MCKYEEEVPEICVDKLGEYEEIELDDGTIEYRSERHVNFDMY
ncbi:hypothetical protein PN294_05085 [Romboutsia sp. 1001216sp1]|nr:MULTISPECIES: hypothetical protein [unclassified Romboutsia]MDB8801565.1 hypothetical protein [Romboutsia sp. 1001216sp1]MDB8812962.1 hypothetical protein [Romboutsia sp. 1001216sp1]